MAINVNGYNDTFQSFVDFARIRDGMGDKTAIARVTEGVNVAGGALAGRTITASDTDSIRGIFKWFRKPDDQKANDATRKIFRDAIIDMFGGENKIPASALVGQGNDLRYKLEVSEDKKTATITMSANYDLKFCVEGAGYEGYNTCGNVQYSSQFKFDISGDELKMVSCHTSQHIEP